MPCAQRGYSCLQIKLLNFLIPKNNAPLRLQSMFFDAPLHISLGLMQVAGTQVAVRYKERIPVASPILIVSNHRSFLDAPLVMTALGCSVRFACHHYMSQVPVLKEMIAALGCIPLDEPRQRRRLFFQQAIDLLREHQPIGIFPEGTRPMIRATEPQQLERFHRGFAHLALRVPVQSLAILPIAISAIEEAVHPTVPLKLLSLFDPSEPLFDRPGWHPAVNYRQVNVSIGHPIWVTSAYREQYRGRQAGQLAKELTQACHSEIAQLLRQGFS